MHIGVVWGSAHGEREVSWQSAKHIASGLESSGYRVSLHEFTPPYTDLLQLGADLIFNACHGLPGEGGIVSAICELHGVPYTGSNAASSMVSMHKTTARKCLELAGIPVADAQEIASLGELEEFVGKHDGKGCLKPVIGGSSLGIQLIGANHQTCGSAFAASSDTGGEFFVEELLTTDYTVGIIGEKSLPMIEIRPTEEFYNYHAKYVSDRTEFFAPNLPAEEIAEGEAISRAAFTALGCSGWGRVDLMRAPSQREGQSQWRVLEVNVVPGMTTHSLVPKAAAEAGMTFPELVSAIVETALDQK